MSVDSGVYRRRATPWRSTASCLNSRAARSGAGDRSPISTGGAASMTMGGLIGRRPALPDRSSPAILLHNALNVLYSISACAFEIDHCLSTASTLTSMSSASGPGAAGCSTRLLGDRNVLLVGPPGSGKTTTLRGSRWTSGTPANGRAGQRRGRWERQGRLARPHGQRA